VLELNKDGVVNSGDQLMLSRLTALTGVSFIC